MVLTMLNGFSARGTLDWPMTWYKLANIVWCQLRNLFFESLQLENGVVPLASVHICSVRAECCNICGKTLLDACVSQANSSTSQFLWPTAIGRTAVGSNRWTSILHGLYAGQSRYFGLELSLP